MTAGDTAGRAGRLRRALFPGDQRVWLVAGAVLGVIAVVVLVELLTPRAYFTGTNSVAAREARAILPPETPLCVRGLQLPAGTGAVRFSIDTGVAPRPRLDLAIYTAGGQVIRGSLPAASQTGLNYDDIPIPTRPSAPAVVAAEVCVTPKSRGRQTIYVWGRSMLQGNDIPVLVAGQPIDSRIGVWFLPPNHQQRSLISHMGEMFRRAALFRPWFVGEWTYWLLLFGVLPGLGYAGLRIIAVGGRRRGRVPTPVKVGLIAFGMAASWAFVTPAFQSPDEAEHFAYAQYFAETGRAVDPVASVRPVYSDEETLALEAVREPTVIERADAKPPWMASDVAAWRQRHDSQRPPPKRNDGGGFHPATSPHSPAYYALLAPAYLAVHHGSVFTQLTAMRLTSALLGALTAALAVLIVLELLPGWPALAAAAGLLIAFEPMFGFISGAVNNDNGVNLACAVIIYLVVRALRRGLTPWLAAGLAVALVVGPLLKGTGYELYPPALAALVVVMIRRHGRRDWLALAVGLATFAVLQVGWDQLLAPSLHRTVFTTPGGASPVVSLPAYTHITGYFSWLARVVLPFKLPFLYTNWTTLAWPAYDIYIVRGFGSFGWYAIQFPDWVYRVILAALVLLAALGITVITREWARVRSRLPEIAFLVVVPVVVIAAVEAAYYPTVHLPIDGIQEQGRYLFPAITALAALVVGACFGLGRRRAVPLAGGLVAALIGLSLASQLLTLSTFYT